MKIVIIEENCLDYNNLKDIISNHFDINHSDYRIAARKDVLDNFLRKEETERKALFKINLQNSSSDIFKTSFGNFKLVMKSGKDVWISKIENNDNSIS